MIIWIYGQHNAGKTTCASLLAEELVRMGVFVNMLDGDHFRDITQNFDYSAEGRRQNIEQAIDIAEMLSSDNRIVIASFITPYFDQRTRLLDSEEEVILVQVETSRVSATPFKACADYEARVPSVAEQQGKLLMKIHTDTHQDALNSVRRLAALINERVKSAAISLHLGEGI